MIIKLTYVTSVRLLRLTDIPYERMREKETEWPCLVVYKGQTVFDDLTLGIKSLYVTQCVIGFLACIKRDKTRPLPPPLEAVSHSKSSCLD